MTAMDAGRREMSSVIDAAVRRYRHLQGRRVSMLVLLAAGAMTAFCIDLAVGPSDLSVAELIRSLLGGATAGHSDAFIVWQLRLPQAVLAALIGCSLGVAGLEMQTVLDNALADPFTLGVSSAAAFGAALAIVLGVGLPGIPEAWFVSGNAFVFAFGSLLVLLLFVRSRVAGAERLVLFGIATSFAFGALLALLQFVASPDVLQQLTFWTMGSLVRARWEGIAIVAGANLLVLPFSFRTARRMNALRLGEDRAASLGVDVGLLRLGALLRISLLAATAVAAAGIIGFIGLIGPHIARLLIGADHRFLLPASALVAMIVMSVAAAACKAAIPGVVVPIGILTALVGLPVFFLLILTRHRT